MRLKEAKDPDGSILSTLADHANEHFGEMLGLRVEDVAIEDSVSFICGHDVLAQWRLKAWHDIPDAEMRGLGFRPTGKPVYLAVLSRGVATIKGNAVVGVDWEHTRFDALSALSQIGVKAVGRPLVEYGEYDGRVPIPTEPPLKSARYVEGPLIGKDLPPVGEEAKRFTPDQLTDRAGRHADSHPRSPQPGSAVPTQHVIA